MIKGTALAAETEFNWMKLIHLPAEMDPRGHRGRGARGVGDVGGVVDKNQLQLTSH